MNPLRRDEAPRRSAGTTANPVAAHLLTLAEAGVLPDAAIRWGIRRLLAQRLREIDGGGCETRMERLTQFIAHMDASPVAVAVADANRQHYELPAEFFATVLGPHLKYSSCLWPRGVNTLAGAEEAMLALSCARAEIADGMRVLDLGCGWGSLSLWIAGRYPACRVEAVSNSCTQRRFIEQWAASRGLANLRVTTCDMNRFAPQGRFDRVVSVEMFEHMRNYRALLGRVADWLEPGGALFLHIFTHREFPYRFEARDESDWMSRYFFTGGMMPSDGLPLYFQDRLSVEAHWRVNGRHYERTLNAWLARADRHRANLAPVFRRTYGDQDAARWWQRWRIFFLACAELFGYAAGNEWFVSHYRFRKGSSA